MTIALKNIRLRSLTTGLIQSLTNVTPKHQTRIAKATLHKQLQVKLHMSCPVCPVCPVCPPCEFLEVIHFTKNKFYTKIFRKYKAVNRRGNACISV